METRAVARFVRISPRKARLVTDIIKGKDPDEALNILQFTPKGASPIVAKVIKSALANARQNPQINADNLSIERAYVNQGSTLKRFRARAMGRASRIKKCTSHITIVLKEKS